MKNNLLLTLIFAIALLSLDASAQYYYLPSATNGNPGGINTDSEYPVGGGLATTWSSISTPSATTPAWSTTQTLPFAFQFNGSAVTQYKVSTSGVLTFDVSATTAPSYTKAALPDAGIPNNSVCIWGLAAPGANDIIVNKTFGTAPNRQHWIMFSSFGVPGASCWTYWSIVLEESTQKIYLVDQRNSCTGATFSMGIQVNSTTAYTVAGNPSTPSLAGTAATAVDNKYYEFIPGSQPQNNLIGSNSLVANYLVLNQGPFPIAATYLNGGASTVTSATANYKINNGATVSAPVSGLAIATGTTGTITHPTAWTPAATGTYQLKFWTSNPNGVADDVPANDTLTKTVVVVSNIAVRKPLIEVFSSSTCAPCAPANTTFKALMDQQTAGDYHYIKYQMSWPGTGDPYYTAEAGSKRVFYNVNSVPNAQIDGGWNGHAGQITQTLLAQFKSVPSFMNMSGYYTVTGQKVDMVLNITPLVTTSKTLTLNVGIMEKSTTQNVKSNGETTFYHVMKKMVPDAAGTPFTNITENVMQTLNLSYTFNGSYTLPANASAPVNHATAHTVENFNNLSVMAWVQDNSTKEIYQSAELAASGIGAEENVSATVGIYPVPASDVVYMDFGRVSSSSVVYSVKNTAGQIVATGTVDPSTGIQTLPVSAFSTGLYFLEWSAGDLFHTQRFSVVH